MIENLRDSFAKYTLPLHEPIKSSKNKIPSQHSKAHWKWKVWVMPKPNSALIASQIKSTNINRRQTQRKKMWNYFHFFLIVINWSFKFCFLLLFFLFVLMSFRLLLSLIIKFQTVLVLMNINRPTNWKWTFNFIFCFYFSLPSFYFEISTEFFFPDSNMPPKNMQI